MTEKSVMIAMMTGHVAEEDLSGFRRKYLWWEPAVGHAHSDERVIAQVMNLATYDDILLLERTVGHARLVDVMLGAAAGWFNDRSSGFWRGRLSVATGAAIPVEPPRRVFDAPMS